ncbi:MAG: hypothetical protein ACTSR8_16520 [Promethearchaeota archaeon]
MADISINAILILATLFILFAVFLLFDLFKRNEKYGYFAYIIAVIPVNYLWYLSADIETISVLTSYLLLFSLWNLCMLRDIIGVWKKKKDFDDQLLFLGLGILVQLILTAILPSPQLNPLMQQETTQLSYFFVPDIYRYNYSSIILTGTRIMATILIFLAIIPMILDIKDEPIPFPVIIIILIIFIGPFIYLGYLWYADAMFILAFLFEVILLIILLMITRSGNE